jgi:glucosamine--fructose-6-phosphate aminotransferase (isomerizing)
MCGIVGYVGTQSPKEILLESLQRLEYRGYDSAGVAILDQGTFKRVRAEGKLINLSEKLSSLNFTGPVGIGHTRWATHGAPIEKNAHPHCVEGISLVHNGIIENYAEIKKDLLAHGRKIESDTDSELVAHLIVDEIKIQKDLLQAVLHVIGKLRGAYSILVVWDEQPNEIVAFKDGPPLIVGLGREENFIVSDIQAAIKRTRDFVYLEDREVAVIQKEAVKFYSAAGIQIIKESQRVDWSGELAEKSGYPHFMLKEIYEQPAAVAASMKGYLNAEDLSVELSLVKLMKNAGLSAGLNDQFVDRWSDFKNIYIVACGTSFYSGLYGRYLFEKIARVQTQVEVASEFRYREPVMTEDTLFIVISQSGETADTLAALRLAKSQGLKTLSLCNVPNSTLDREAHYRAYMNSGPEIGVASTKAFASSLALLHVMALAMAKEKQVLTPLEEKNFVQALLALPSQLEVVLAYDKYFADAAEALSRFRGFLYMGRGVHYPIALEGALKLKELAYLHAEGYAAGEMKHGPLALIDKDMAILMLAPSDDLFEKTLSNLEEARARGGKIISVGTGQNKKLKALSERYLAVPETLWSVYPIIEVIPLQLMAYHLASSLGYDVDQPRNLAKSVTVE